ncbi:hypothetical protein E8E13_008061 [Curvularia kusanoi]|uniref:Uncharacterized protein n=1 Tax=Curvularia kusanoi TaxID=90978 RepID=A0A9P4TB42_CURKU|nr:hypothetical protein E8E13_008061 [Curvularia kusanoi]
MSTTQPFRFLDLPAELRLMVYERLPVSPITVVYKVPTADDEYLLFTSMKFQTALPSRLRGLPNPLPKMSCTSPEMHARRPTHPHASTLHTTDLAPRELALRKMLGLYSNSETFKKAREMKALSDFCVDAMEHLSTTGCKLRLELYCPNFRDADVAALRNRLDGGNYYPRMSYRVLEKRPRALGLKGASIAGGVVYGEDVSGQLTSGE